MMKNENTKKNLKITNDKEKKSEKSMFVLGIIGILTPVLLAIFPEIIIILRERILAIAGIVEYLWTSVFDYYRHDIPQWQYQWQYLIGALIVGSIIIIPPIPVGIIFYLIVSSDKLHAFFIVTISLFVSIMTFFALILIFYLDTRFSLPVSIIAAFIIVFVFLALIIIFPVVILCYFNKVDLEVAEQNIKNIRKYFLK